MRPKNRLFFAASLILATIGSLALSSPEQALTAAVPRLKLSEYGFFAGQLSNLTPADHVYYYEVNAPLFSDYAEKQRLIYLPPGTKMSFQPNAAFDFPDGAVIIKNFFYWTDANAPEKGRNILETRLLLKENNAWKALVYVWNKEQTDAVLEVAGASFPVQWTTHAGKKATLEYAVPNLNQCKGCHSYSGQFVPIGTTARQLNRTEKQGNQLLYWAKLGILDLPANLDVVNIPTLFDYRTIQHPDKTDAAKLNSAARAYLDGNCAHCHNPNGPASTSGMFLEFHQTDPERIGVGKPPVAAGRGSGNRKYGIVPGKPGESILYYRMEQDDPGIRMPELGRQLAHKEGLEIIKYWIKSL